jgi:glycosyltransferase involved in cell wall biosynthesis
MKLLLAHNHRFHVYEENYYSNGSFSSEALLRYTKAFENVVFVSRHVLSDREPKNMSLATTEKVTFVSVPDFESAKHYLKKFEADKIIRKEVQIVDYVIARMPSSIGAIAVKYAKKFNKPYLVEMVACPWDSYWNHSLRGKLMAPFYYLSTKRIVLKAPYVVYVTNEFLQKRYPTRGKQTNCSNVALKAPNDMVLKQRLSKIQDKKEGSKIVIGTVAAVNVRFKGQQFIIEALGQLKRKGLTRYEYQLVGGGDQAYLKSVAEKHDVVDQVIFMNSLPHDIVFSWLETIDLYVQPSRQEGLPRALIEAMSRGVPAFGARTAGIPELLEHSFTFSNTKRNVSEICTILETFDRKKMRDQALRNFEESRQYQQDVIEKRRNAFFDEFKYSSR